MREHTYRPEFAADSTAVSTTKFMMSPANGMPIDWNTSTNGLVSTPDLRHGISAAMTAIEPMKKIARRSTVVCTAFGIAVGRVLRLAGGDADHFGAGEGEHDGQQRGENRQHAVGQPAVAVTKLLEHRARG